jgi:hypothetical protein
LRILNLHPWHARKRSQPAPRSGLPD